MLTLAESLSGVFPSTPLAYLKYRSEDLVGRDAAIARLTDELLENPRPPEGWAEAASEEVEEQVAGCAPTTCSPWSPPSGDWRRQLRLPAGGGGPMGATHAAAHQEAVLGAQAAAAGPRQVGGWHDGAALPPAVPRPQGEERKTSCEC